MDKSKFQQKAHEKLRQKVQQSLLQKSKQKTKPPPSLQTSSHDQGLPAKTTINCEKTVQSEPPAKRAKKTKGEAQKPFFLIGNFEVQRNFARYAFWAIIEQHDQAKVKVIGDLAKEPYELYLAAGLPQHHWHAAAWQVHPELFKRPTRVAAFQKSLKNWQLTCGLSYALNQPVQPLSLEEWLRIKHPPFKNASGGFVKWYLEFYSNAKPEEAEAQIAAYASVSDEEHRKLREQETSWVLTAACETLDWWAELPKEKERLHWFHTRSFAYLWIPPTEGLKEFNYMEEMPKTYARNVRKLALEKLECDPLLRRGKRKSDYANSIEEEAFEECKRVEVEIEKLGGKIERTPYPAFFTHLSWLVEVIVLGRHKSEVALDDNVGKDASTIGRGINSMASLLGLPMPSHALSGRDKGSKNKTKLGR